MKNNKFNKSVIFAITLHAGLLLCLFLYINNNEKIGTDTKVAIFHVYEAPSLPQAEEGNLKQKLLTSPSRNLKQISSNQSSQVETKNLKYKSPSSSFSHLRERGKREGKLSSLIKLIESDIEQHKYYPQLALQQHQQGNVTITFELHPDGQITDIHVAKSSHVVTLDSAAINAVTSAGPIPTAKKYLHHDEQIKIRLRYQLS